MGPLAGRLRSFFKIRADETRLVLLLTTLMFLAATGGAIGSPGVEALFYARFGVRFLPHMYVSLGITTVIVSLGVTALLARTSSQRLYAAMPPALGLLLVGARGVLSLELRWFYPVLWLGMNIMWSLQALFGWGLAAVVCDTRQAKRLFPLFGAGSILGLALGGILTQPIVSRTGSENLLLFWAAALAAVTLLARKLVADHAGRVGTTSRQGRSFLEGVREGYHFARESPLMSWVARAAVLFAILYFFIVFPFARAAAAEFPDEDALAGFLGIFQGLSTGLAILLSLVFANRFYARFGFMTAIFVYPLLYFFGFSLLTVAAVFPVLAGLRFTQIIWSEGFAEGANQGMFNVVPPAVREQTRTFIRGVANQLGVSLAGAMLLLSEQWLLPQYMFIIGAAAAALTAYFVWRARSAYGAAVVEALRAGQPHIFFAEEEPFGGFRRDKEAVAVAIAGIRDRDAAVRRVAARILGNLAVPEATEAIVQALRDPDASVRAALLRALAKARATSALLEVPDFLHDPEPEVRLQAIETLRQLAGFPRGLQQHVEPFLEDADPAVRCAAAAVLLEEGPHDGAERTLQEMVTSDDVEARVAALKALARWGSQNAYELAGQALRDPSPAVRRHAAAVMARIDATQCIFPLVAALADRDESVRKAVAEALGRVGEPALDPVLSALHKPDTERGALLALNRLPARHHADEIHSYAERKVALALKYGARWRACGDGDPGNERTQLLADTLGEVALGNATNALLAAGALGNGQAISFALEQLDSRLPEQRANALETLETMAPPALFRPLAPLWDSGAEMAAPEEKWLLETLEDADPWLRACAALAATEVNDPEVHKRLEDLAEEDPEKMVRQVARHALDGDRAMDTLPTLSPMERILFLRRVPLFSDFSPSELKYVAEVATEKAFSDGQILVRQGEPGDEMYMIVAGEVRVLVKAKDGRTHDYGHRQPGEHVGEMALINDIERSATLVAVGDVRALCLNREQFEEIIRTRPEAGLAVMRVLSTRLIEAMSE